MNNEMQKRLLIADNDADYRRSLSSLLKLDEYKVEEASSVDEAKEILETVPLDLVLVDLRLSDNDNIYDFSGLDIAKFAMQRNISCIIITAFPSVEATRVALRSRGTKSLADDFVPKKDGPQPVLDAINVVLHNRKEYTPEPCPVVDLKVDLKLRLVWNRGKLLELSKYQYALLAYLFQKEGVVCANEELVKAVYGDDNPDKNIGVDRCLEHLVERIREKIEDDASNPKKLIIVPGRGFRLVL